MLSIEASTGIRNKEQLYNLLCSRAPRTLPSTTARRPGTLREYYE